MNFIKNENKAWHKKKLQTILGKQVYRPAKLDQKLVREFMSLVDPTQDAYETVCGKTMCTNDFYEGILRISVLEVIDNQKRTLLLLCFRTRST